MVLSVIKYVIIVLEILKALKLQYWFKSYCNFADWVDFAYWWSFSDGEFALNMAILSSFRLSVNNFVFDKPIDIFDISLKKIPHMGDKASLDRCG